jgi:predicted small secreted protein
MRRSALSYAVVVLVALLAAGCRASLPGAGQERPGQQWIGREQIEEPRFSSAYDVVRALRSNWLSTRGIASLRLKTEVQVYLDGVHLGGVDMLKSISTPAIQYIRYFNGTDATTRWGIGHGRGVIYIGTGPMPDPGAPPP